jgi:hypothetical protein
MWIGSAGAPCCSHSSGLPGSPKPTATGNFHLDAEAKRLECRDVEGLGSCKIADSEAEVVDHIHVAGHVPSLTNAEQRLSVPLIHNPDTSAPRPAWLRVRKCRQIAWVPADGADRDTGCSVELTEVEVLGEMWWTLGFEARGDAALESVERTAAMVLARPLPGTEGFTAKDSCSYGEWVHELTNP